MLIGSFFYSAYLQIPSLPDQKVTALFSPASLQPHQTPFQKGLVYKGTLSNHSFTLPCSIYLKKLGPSRPLANTDYIIRGDLQQRAPHEYVVKVEEWHKIEKSFSLAETRYQLKEAFRRLLSSKIPSKKAHAFLSSLSTGDIEDRSLRYELGRLGLQHILAISGFHFAILLSFLSLTLQLFLSKRNKIFLLFCAMTFYYLFVGPSAAIGRSYLTAIFYLLGKLINRPTSGLNLLGCAMGAEVLTNPLISSDIGFQLSFLSCFAILLLFPWVEEKVEWLLPKRKKSERLALSLRDKQGYLLATFLRQSLSLTFAVNLLLWPLLLFHFHQFPLLGFLYNLFFPFCVGISLFLLLSSLIFHLLFPPLAALFYWMTSGWTQFLLELTSYPPLPLAFTIETNAISSVFVIIYIAAIALWQIGTHHKIESHLTSGALH